MADLEGYSALMARFRALQGQQKVKYLGAIAVGELRRNVPRKTSTTSRSIHVASVTDTTAHIRGSVVGLYLDQGTGLYGPLHRRITPQAARALRWFGGNLRLSGRPRIAGGVAQGGAIFARSTKGMKARPFIRRSIQAAASKLGLGIIKTWNDAA